MLNIEKLQAGRIHSFKHNKTIEFKKFENGAGERIPCPEWLQRANVTREASFKGNLAGKETYGNLMRRDDPDWQPSRAPWFHWGHKDGLVFHKTSGAAYLAVANPETIKATYFVNGVIATEAQAQEIERWRKGGGKEMTNFATFSLESVEYCASGA